MGIRVITIAVALFFAHVFAPCRASDVTVPLPEVRGERYEAEVPDTLDLARRAEYALNALTSNVVPERDYAVWQAMQLHTNPPSLVWTNWQIAAKYVESIPRMRKMSGSTRNLDEEKGLMEAFLNRIGEDGLPYYPVWSPDHPGDTVNAMICGRLILAMVNFYDRDGDPAWIERIRKMAHGLCEIAIKRYDYAYYPLESGYTRDGTWTFTKRSQGRPDYFPYSPPDEPARDQQGNEGSVKFDMATPVRGLVKAYELTGDKEFLETSRLLVNWCLLPTMWEDGWAYNIAGHEHGLFSGHFHGNTMSLRGILEYAVAANNQKIMGTMRDAYEHARRLGVARTGWFPSWITPEKYGRPGWIENISESCITADMIALAIMLTDAGIGDYWDDVDHYTRNQLVENQLIDVERLESVALACKALPRQEFETDLSIDSWGHSIENVVQKTVGSFTGMGTPSNVEEVLGGGCCTGNSSLALYDAWEAIVRYKDGQATVNLLLNRASPWVDIASSLPYEGRVILSNKTAKVLAVRIPGWVGLTTVQSTVDGAAVKPPLAGRHVVFSGLSGGERIELRFDVPEDEAEYIASHKTFRFRFRGSTAIEITPAKRDEFSYPTYQRSHMTAGPAPMVKRELFVSELVSRP